MDTKVDSEATAAPEADEDLLRGILGVGVGRGEAAGERPDQPAVAVDALAHGGCVARRNALEEGLWH
jgi:hypothetical protein